MRSIKIAGIVAATGMAMAGVTQYSVVAAPARTQVASDAKSVSLDARVAAFNQTLKPAQRQALIDAARGWEALADRPEVLFAQVQKDVTRILRPAQAREFMALIEPSIAGGGVYKPIICFLESKVALLFSVIALIGCPSDTAEDATYKAWAASQYAGECLVSGDETCDSAAYSALDAYSLWSTLTGTCDLADTAMYSCLLTYAGCGGTW